MLVILAATGKFVPVIVMSVPATDGIVVVALPLAGEKLVIVAVAALIVSTAPLVAVPLGVVTVIEPVVVPTATVAVMRCRELTVKLAAAVPLNLTAETLTKLVPVIMTLPPTAVVVGVNDEIVGTPTT